MSSHEMEDRYPLHWPAGRPRAKRRDRSRFGEVPIGRAIRELQAELDRLDARAVVLSSNLELRLDGLPRADRRRPEDPGVAVFFNFAGDRRALACDRWDLVEHNLRAITRHIEAMRGMERWGVVTLEQAFEAYRALPARGETTGGGTWRATLGFAPDSRPDRRRIEDRFRELVIERGADSDVTDLKRARDEARRELEVADRGYFTVRS